jgi:hypothetical protein
MGYIDVGTRGRDLCAANRASSDPDPPHVNVLILATAVRDEESRGLSPPVVNTLRLFGVDGSPKDSG